jgi:hypothetical protein
MAGQTRLSSLLGEPQTTRHTQTCAHDSFQYFRNDKAWVKLYAWTVLQIQLVLTSAFRAAGYAFIFGIGLVSVMPSGPLPLLRRMFGL